MAEWGKLSDDEKKVYTANFKVNHAASLHLVMFMFRTLLASTSQHMQHGAECFKKRALLRCPCRHLWPIQTLSKTPYRRGYCLMYPGGVQEHEGGDDPDAALAAAEAEAKEAAQGGASASAGNPSPRTALSC